MKKIQFIALFSLLFIKNYSQKNDYTVQPPDAASLYKFTEIPVSNTTGIPNTSIPIYNIKLKNFTLPINLSYHSSGINVDEVASDIGLGWSLNAGGMISQQVIGKPDSGMDWPIPQNRPLDDSYGGPALSTSPNQDYEDLRVMNNALTEDDYDSQPDIYLFSFGSFSGKFFFDTNGNAHTIPRSDIKIIRNSFSKFSIYDEMGNLYIYETSSLNRNFSILGYSTNGVGGNSSSDVYSIYLTQIETTNNEIIKFEYFDRTYSYQNPNSHTRKKRKFNDYGLDACNMGQTTPIDPPNNNQSPGFEFEMEDFYKNFTDVYGKSIKKITVNNSEQIIEFNYQTCPRLDLPSGLNNLNQQTTGSFAIKDIKVFNQKNEVIDNFTFNHEYFNLATYQPCITQSNSDTKNFYRLKLKEIVNNNINKYKFEYFEHNFLPGRLSNEYDHWGKFKLNPNGNMYTLDYSYTFVDGANRNPVLGDTKLGTLSKIVYPTGGHTKFNYGLNKYYGEYVFYNAPITHDLSKFLHGTQEIGIPNEYQEFEINFTIQNLVVEGGQEIPPVIRFYSPPIDPSTGMTTNNYYFFTLKNNDTNTYIPLYYAGQNGQAQTLQISNGNYTLFFGGIAEGLGFVLNWIEKAPEIENIYKNMDIGGLRIEEIQNFENSTETIPSTKKIYTYNLNSDSSKSSGKVLSMPFYTYNMNKFRVCKKVIYYHPTLGQSQNQNSFLTYKYTVQHNKPFKPLNLLNGYHIMYPEVQIFDEALKSNGYSTYKYSYVQDDPSYAVNSSSNSYLTNGNYPINPVTSLDFLRGNLLEETLYKKTNNSFTKAKETFYTYENDSDSDSFFNSVSNTPYRIGLNLIQLLEEKFIMRLVPYNTPWPDERFPALYSLGYYKLQSARTYLSQKKERIYDLNGNNPIESIVNYYHDNANHVQTTKETLTTSTGQLFETKYQYAHEVNNLAMINRNMIGIPLITETFRNNEKLSTQVTTYKDWGNNLLAPEIIKTSKANQNLEDRIKYNLVDTNGNPLEVQQVDGIKIVYIWGYNKTLPIAKIENASYADVQSHVSNLQSKSNTGTENELIEDLNNLRNALPNAMVTTYTYKPLVGVSTITDPKGNQTTYDYDSFNRLKYIKDHQGNIIKEHNYNYRPN